MSQQEPVLTDIRRRALDRLLVQYLELEDSKRAAFMQRCQARFPRLYRWFAELASGSETISLLDRPPRTLVGEALAGQPEQAMTLEPGRRLGPWRVVEPVGEGGMGKVYRGQRADGAFEMDVAIKLLRLRRPGLAEQLQRESRMLARLDHGAITRLLDAGLDEQGGPFLVMEWVEGDDLEDWREGKPGLEACLQVVEQLAGALGHAHQRLIVHGDIKPGNVRIRDNDQVKLLDFGVARLIAEGDGIEAGLAALTPAFAAPEQCAGQPPGTRSDIWSLGALLGWLLLGEVPGQVDDATRSMRISQRYPRGRELAGIVNMACAPDPDDRYASVEEMAADIDAYRAHHPLRCIAPTAPERVMKFTRRNRLLVGAAAAVFVALVAGMGTTLGMYFQAQQEAERTLAANERTEAVKEFLIDMISEADQWANPGEMPTVRDVLDRSRQTVEPRFADQPDIAAELLGVIGSSYLGLAERGPARETLARALEIAEAGTVPELPPETLISIELAYTNILEGDPEVRVERLERLLEKVQGLPDSEATEAQLLNLLAWSDLWEDDVEAGFEKIRKASELTCNKDREMPRDCINQLSDKKYYYSRLGKGEEGLRVARKAWKLTEENYPDQSHPLFMTAGTTYGEALANNQRPGEAIILLDEVRQMARDIFGKDHVMEAYVAYPLARAYWQAGKTHQAWQVLKGALDKVARVEPESQGIPVQLNFLPRMLFSLYKTDMAEKVMTRYDEGMTENPPVHSIAPRRINELQLVAMRDPGSPSVRRDMRELAADLEEQDSPMVGRAIYKGLLEAIEAGDRDDAARWLEDLEAIDSPAVSQANMSLARARLALLHDQPDRAREYAETSRVLLMDKGETMGPRVARTQAIQSEALCRKGRAKDGQELLTQARSYWQDVAQVEAGDEAMVELAPSCAQSDSGLSTDHE